MTVLEAGHVTVLKAGHVRGVRLVVLGQGEIEGGIIVHHLNNSLTLISKNAGN